MNNKQAKLRSLPKVDESLALLKSYPEIKTIPASLMKKAVREIIDLLRQKVLQDESIDLPEDNDEWAALFLQKLQELNRDNYRRVINGTGIVVHTNLGRSLLSQSSVDKLVDGAMHYTNLEFDLVSGKRGSRYSLVESIICDITGAEAALVVNNNAAAVFIALETLASGGEAIVSRGQLVEIGGSFRIPDIMAKSGAQMVEIGATNRTHLYDYENAITEKTNMLLRVHTSNFRQIGFTSDVSATELVELAHKHDLLVMEDLGSGSVIDMSRFGLPVEPRVQDIINAGVDVVTFSGDKLLGGPQAGIIVGKKVHIDRIKKNPLNRAMRIDKFTLATLESTFRSYYDIERACEDIPTLRMISDAPETIKKRAQRFLRRFKKKYQRAMAVKVADTASMVGGGALPEYMLKSSAVEFIPESGQVTHLERRLRALDIPIIGRIENDKFLIDFRTVQDHECLEVADIMAECLNSFS
ncbi:MAG: L-seryl-tRNA(Sec) selenium transferase [Desulfobulbaceae bacterium]|nr:MAG: L-seryl-tRNA(Sec) selenium transferase [Desulfobulbaceae bacterium]